MPSQAQKLKMILTIILTSSITIFLHAAEAGDDEALIKRFCDKTNDTQLCYDCIKHPSQAPDSIITDTNVINALLDCARTVTTDLRNATEEGLNNTSLDPEFRAALNTCLGIVDNVSDGWVIVRENVVDRLFLAARSAIDAFVIFPLNQCAAAVGTKEPVYYAIVLNVEKYYTLPNQAMAGLSS